MAITIAQLRAEVSPDLAPLDRGLAEADRRLREFADRARARPPIEPGDGTGTGGRTRARPPEPIDERIARTLEEIAQRANAAAGAADKVKQSLGETGVQANRSERELLQYASAMARLQQRQGDAAGAAKTLEQALAQVDTRTIQGVRATQQLTRAQQDLERAQQSAETKSRSFGDVLGRLQGAFAGLGIAVGVEAIVQFGGEAIAAANSLERTEATVLALSGSQERYNEVLALASEGQRLYGGSLEANIKGLGSLVNLSNRSGVELQQLDNISRRLATVDAAQGIEGASFALKEFLSSNNAEAARSLIERFELSPQLKAIATSGASASEKIAALDAELNNLGITNEVLTNQGGTTAAAYTRLGASFDNLKVRIGSFLSEAGRPTVEFLTDLFDLLNGAGSDEGTQRLIVGLQRLVASTNPLIETELRLKEAINARTGASQQAIDAFSPEALRGYVDQAKNAAEQLGALQDAAGAQLQATGTAFGELIGLYEPLSAGERQFAQSIAERLGLVSAAEAAANPEIFSSYAAMASAAGDRITGVGEQLEAMVQKLEQRFPQITAIYAALDAGEAVVRSAIEERLAVQEQSEQLLTSPAFGAYAAAAQDAATRLANVGEQATRSSEEIEKLQAKLVDASEQGAEATERLRDAQTKYADETAAKQEQLQARLVAATQDGADRQVAIAEQAATQRQQIDETANERRADAATALNEALRTIDTQLADEQTQLAEQRTERLAQIQERLVTAAAANADQVAQIDERLNERREAEAAQSTQKIADLQRRLVDQQQSLNDELADQQREFEERLSDAKTKSADDRADRVADRDSKLADLQESLSDAKTKKEKDRIREQIADLEREFAEKEARIARDEARELERLERDRQRSEQQAREKAERQAAELQRQIAEEEAAAAARQAKLEAEAIKERERQAAKFAQQQADLQQQLAAEDAAAAARLAKLLATSAAERQQAQADLAARLTEIDQEQAASLAKLDAKTAAEQAKAAEATAAKIAELQTAFATEEATRQRAFDRQEAQLREALGKQLAAYVEYQQQLGILDKKTADNKLKAIQERFGGRDDQNSAEFAALAATLGNERSASLAGNALNVLAQGSLNGLPGIGALSQSIGSISIVVPGSGDPAATAQAIRDELARIAFQNGSSGIT